MTKEKFIDIMVEIKINQEYTQTLWNILNDEVMDKLFRVNETSVKILEEHFQDKSEWVNWFIFETEFGTKNRIVTFDGKEVDISSVQKLYDFLISNKENRCE